MDDPEPPALISLPPDSKLEIGHGQLPVPLVYINLVLGSDRFGVAYPPTIARAIAASILQAADDCENAGKRRGGLN